MSTLKSTTLSLNAFRKHYCPHCGNELKKQKEVSVLHKGDEGFRKNHLGTGYNPSIDTNEITTYSFSCIQCNEQFSDDDLSKIRKMQRAEKSKILKAYASPSEEDVCLAHESRLALAIHQIKKLKWLLLFPVIGWLICIIVMYSNELSEKIDTKETICLMLSPVAAFVAVAGFFKFILSACTDLGVPVDCQGLIMWIPALFAANLPILWYINHKFK